MTSSKILIVIFLFTSVFTPNIDKVFAEDTSEAENSELLDFFEGDLQPDSSQSSEKDKPQEKTNPKLSNPSNPSNQSGLTNQSLPDTKDSLTNSSVDDDIRKTFTYGTYQDQSEVLIALAKNCKQKDSRDGLNVALNFLEQESFFKSPFKNDEGLVVAVIGLIQECRLFEKRGLIQEVLTDEVKYRKYREGVRAEMKIKALSTLTSFYDQLPPKEKEDIAKLLDKYYRFDRFHDDNWKIKMEVLMAAAKFKPKGFNKLLKREYSKEKIDALRNSIIETIGLYQDNKDLDFLDQIVQDTETSSFHRWVAVVAFTNYVDNPAALRKVKEYTRMNESAIVSRAYYVLSFFNLKLDFFLEAARNNNENIRLQAVQALSRFPFEDVKEVLEYKSKKDKSPAVRKKAEEILKDNNPETTK